MFRPEQLKLHVTLFKLVMLNALLSSIVLTQ